MVAVAFDCKSPGHKTSEKIDLDLWIFELTLVNAREFSRTAALRPGRQSVYDEQPFNGSQVFAEILI